MVAFLDGLVGYGHGRRWLVVTLLSQWWLSAQPFAAVSSARPDTATRQVTHSKSHLPSERTVTTVSGKRACRVRLRTNVVGLATGQDPAQGARMPPAAAFGVVTLSVEDIGDLPQGRPRRPQYTSPRDGRLLGLHRDQLVIDGCVAVGRGAVPRVPARCPLALPATTHPQRDHRSLVFTDRAEHLADELAGRVRWVVDEDTGLTVAAREHVPAEPLDLAEQRLLKHEIAGQ